MNKNIFVHETAIVEEGVKIGHGTKIWDNTHIRRGVSIGKNCIIGGKNYIAYDVKIGNLVKINSFIYICAGVTIKDKVMVSAGVIFTNDRFPRSVKSDSESLFTSGPTEETQETKVEKGVTIGAGSVIGCGITLGEYCMIGMGSVVTKDVLSYSLVYGTPAKIKGYVCKCGRILELKKSLNPVVCKYCKNRYSVSKIRGYIRLNPNK